jgi:hypothetical protein
MRIVRVRCKWESEHTVEVPDDTPRLSSSDLGGLLDASDDDVTAECAELVDWEIIDQPA